MHVIAHQGIRVDLAAESFRLFEQVSQILEVMNLEDEARPSIDGALDDVLGNSGEVESGWPGHAGNMRVRSARFRREMPEPEPGV
jgi:hypothetical protein